jgi:phage regulator Rha-like protein
MLELTVENKNGVLVVDSRLIAEELGIEHKTLKETIRHYEDQLSNLTELRAETLKGKSLPQGGFGKGENIYWLDEEQATFVMMLSRNTSQVVDAKLKLARTFGAAKQVIQSINPELLSMFSEMNSRMKLLSERTEKLDSMEKATSNNRGIKGVIDTEVLELYPETLSYTVKEYLQMKGVDERHLNTMRKRAVMFANQGKQINLPRKGNEYVFRGNDISYLDQALKTVLGLD